MLTGISWVGAKDAAKHCIIISQIKEQTFRVKR